MPATRYGEIVVVRSSWYTGYQRHPLRALGNSSDADEAGLNAREAAHEPPERLNRSPQSGPENHPGGKGGRAGGILRVVQVAAERGGEAVAGAEDGATAINRSQPHNDDFATYPDVGVGEVGEGERRPQATGEAALQANRIRAGVGNDGLCGDLPEPASATGMDETNSDRETGLIASTLPRHHAGNRREEYTAQAAGATDTGPPSAHQYLRPRFRSRTTSKARMKLSRCLPTVRVSGTRP